MGIPEREQKGKGTESLSKEIIDKNSLNLRKEMDIRVHVEEANRTPNYLSAKRPSPTHIMLTVRS